MDKEISRPLYFLDYGHVICHLATQLAIADLCRPPWDTFALTGRVIPLFAHREYTHRMTSPCAEMRFDKGHLITTNKLLFENELQFDVLPVCGCGLNGWLASLQPHAFRSALCLLTLLINYFSRTLREICTWKTLKRAFYVQVNPFEFIGTSLSSSIWSGNKKHTLHSIATRLGSDRCPRTWHQPEHEGRKAMK